MIPSNLRFRLAVVLMLALFLIPIGTSSLRGLTHILTCKEDAKTPFQLILPPGGGPPIVSTATRIERGEPRGLCGGLLLDLRARASSRDDLAMIVLLTNTTGTPWKGTVQMALAGASIPVGIGEIAPHTTEEDEIPFKLPAGSFEMSGALLLGP